jgi:hypothetical protein
MKNENQIIFGSVCPRHKNYHWTALIQAVRSVEFYRIQKYWKMGERIFNEEQQ